MAFYAKVNDLNKILYLILFGLPVIASTNIDCDGKPFHCVNSTHFMICVDLGGGISQTIDSFVIQCPATTECRGTNHFECEYVTVPTTVPSINYSSVGNDISQDILNQDWEQIIVTTIKPGQKTSELELSEKYFNGLSLSTLPVDVTTTVANVQESEITTEGLNLNSGKVSTVSPNKYSTISFRPTNEELPTTQGTEVDAVENITGIPRQGAEFTSTDTNVTADEYITSSPIQDVTSGMVVETTHFEVFIPDTPHHEDANIRRSDTIAIGSENYLTTNYAVANNLESITTEAISSASQDNTLNVTSYDIWDISTTPNIDSVAQLVTETSNQGTDDASNDQLVEHTSSSFVAMNDIGIPNSIYSTHLPDEDKSKYLNTPVIIFVENTTLKTNSELSSNNTIRESEIESSVVVNQLTSEILTSDQHDSNTQSYNNLNENTPTPKISFIISAATLSDMPVLEKKAYTDQNEILSERAGVSLSIGDNLLQTNKPIVLSDNEPQQVIDYENNNERLSTIPLNDNIELDLNKIIEQQPFSSRNVKNTKQQETELPSETTPHNLNRETSTLYTTVQEDNINIQNRNESSETTPSILSVTLQSSPLGDHILNETIQINENGGFPLHGELTLDSTMYPQETTTNNMAIHSDQLNQSEILSKDLTPMSHDRNQNNSKFNIYTKGSQSESTNFNFSQPSQSLESNDTHLSTKPIAIHQNYSSWLTQVTDEQTTFQQSSPLVPILEADLSPQVTVDLVQVDFYSSDNKSDNNTYSQKSVSIQQIDSNYSMNIELVSELQHLNSNSSSTTASVLNQMVTDNDDENPVLIEQTTSTIDLNPDFIQQVNLRTPVISNSITVQRTTPELLITESAKSNAPVTAIPVSSHQVHYNIEMNTNRALNQHTEASILTTPVPNHYDYLNPPSTSPTSIQEADSNYSVLKTSGTLQQDKINSPSLTSKHQAELTESYPSIHANPILTLQGSFFNNDNLRPVLTQRVNLGPDNDSRPPLTISTSVIAQEDSPKPSLHQQADSNIVLNTKSVSSPRGDQNFPGVAIPAANLPTDSNVSISDMDDPYLSVIPRQVWDQPGSYYLSDFAGPISLHEAGSNPVVIAALDSVPQVDLYPSVIADDILIQNSTNSVSTSSVGSQQAGSNVNVRKIVSDQQNKITISPSSDLSQLASTYSPPISGIDSTRAIFSSDTVNSGTDSKIVPVSAASTSDSGQISNQQSYLKLSSTQNTNTNSGPTLNRQPDSYLSPSATVRHILSPQVTFTASPESDQKASASSYPLDTAGQILNQKFNQSADFHALSVSSPVLNLSTNSNPTPVPSPLFGKSTGFNPAILIDEDVNQPAVRNPPIPSPVLTQTTVGKVAPVSVPVLNQSAHSFPAAAPVPVAIQPAGYHPAFAKSAVLNESAVSNSATVSTPNMTKSAGLVSNASAYSYPAAVIPTSMLQSTDSTPATFPIRVLNESGNSNPTVFPTLITNQLAGSNPAPFSPVLDTTNISNPVSNQPAAYNPPATANPVVIQNTNFAPAITVISALNQQTKSNKSVNASSESNPPVYSSPSVTVSPALEDHTQRSEVITSQVLIQPVGSHLLTIKSSISPPQATSRPAITSTNLSLNNSNEQNQPSFNCVNKHRGRYADNEDCRKFYVCIGLSVPIAGICPANTVFSEFRKQCTKILSHCVRQNEFRCVSEGRFGDVLKNNVYYICKQNVDATYVRFKFQCQLGYRLNASSVKCVEHVTPQLSVPSRSTEYSSVSIDSSSKSESEVASAPGQNKSNEKDNKEFQCEREGKFAHSSNCRKYYVCKKKKSEFRRKSKKCDSDEVFHKEKKKCVDADSYEC